jgi:hypothetical protein
MLRKRPRMVPQGHSAINRARPELTMVLANKSRRQNLAAGRRPTSGERFLTILGLACRSM